MKKRWYKRKERQGNLRFQKRMQKNPPRDYWQISILMLIYIYPYGYIPQKRCRCWGEARSFQRCPLKRCRRSTRKLADTSRKWCIRGSHMPVKVVCESDVFKVAIRWRKGFHESDVFTVGISLWNDTSGKWHNPFAVLIGWAYIIYHLVFRRLLWRNIRRL